jgi:hypothetical protein
MAGNGPTARPVAGSVGELLAGATGRAPMDKHVDSLSGSGFERATVDGRACVLALTGSRLSRRSARLTTRRPARWQLWLTFRAVVN